MKLHKGRSKPNRLGGHTTGTLCGRENKQSDNGANIADTDAGVTCTFCLKLMDAYRVCKPEREG
jgi:hypothetical protein